MATGNKSTPEKKTYGLDGAREARVGILDGGRAAAMGIDWKYIVHFVLHGIASMKIVVPLQI